MYLIIGGIWKNGYGYYPDTDNIRPDTDTDFFILKFADTDTDSDTVFSWRIRIRIWANPYPFYPFDTPSIDYVNRSHTLACEIYVLNQIRRGLTEMNV